jgi:hypothetical protein
LLAKAPSRDVDDVLDFFELLALLVNRQVLDPEMAWHAYYWPLANYWAASAEYVRAARQEEGSTTWQDLEGLVREVAAIEIGQRPGRRQAGCRREPANPRRLENDAHPRLDANWWERCG